MKRAVVKKPAAVLPAPLPETKPIRACARVGCTTALSPNQRKYCSKVCRNLFLASGANGNGDTNVVKYKPTFAREVLTEYLNFCKEGHEPTLIPTESSYIVIHNAQMPSNEGFAEFLQEHGHVDYVAMSTLDLWSVTYMEFAQALDRIKRIQKSFLLNNGLAGRYNPAISKLALGVNHNMIERKEVESTHKLVGVVKHVYDLADRMQKNPQLPQ